MLPMSNLRLLAKHVAGIVNVMTSRAVVGEPNPFHSRIKVGGGIVQLLRPF